MPAGFYNLNPAGQHIYRVMFYIFWQHVVSPCDPESIMEALTAGRKKLPSVGQIQLMAGSNVKGKELF